MIKLAKAVSQLILSSNLKSAVSQFLNPHALSKEFLNSNASDSGE